MNPILAVYLKHLFRFGNFKLTSADGTVTSWGDGTGTLVHARINTRAAERAIAINPGLKLAECYMDGGVDMLEGSVFDLLTLVFRNAGNDAAREPWMKAIDRMRLVFRRVIQNNTPQRARKNVKHHYDLSAELYDLFLDVDRQYSCAYFETPDVGLDEAQLAKKRHIAAKLNFDRKDLSALDIGCGWGGLGLYLATYCDARVTGVTLSDEQLAIANKRAEKANLSDRAEFRIEDYRATEGPFDRIVSVGMFEHVGKDFYDEFFTHSARLMKDDGVMLLHTIGRYDEPANTNGFIAKYIFPGGYLPSLSQITSGVERAGMIVTDVEVLRLHYAETLKHWRLRFDAERERAKELYDERFCRMWEFYLASSETAFRWQDLVVFQVQIAKRLDTLPMTRSYMHRTEEWLRQRDQDRVDNVVDWHDHRVAAE